MQPVRGFVLLFLRSDVVYVVLIFCCFFAEKFCRFQKRLYFCTVKSKIKLSSQEWLPVASEGLFSCPAGAQHSGCITPWTGRNSLSEAQFDDF